MRCKQLLLTLGWLLIGMQVAFAAGANQNVLFLRKEGKGFDDVFSGMKKELQGKYTVTDFAVEKATSCLEIQEKFISGHPDLIVLMDNKPLDCALKYNLAQTSDSKRMRGVALMGLNLKAILKGNAFISGIAFESPAYTLLIQYRYVVKKPLKHVLAFYRKSLFQETMAAATKQLLTEGVQLEAVNVEAEGVSKDAVAHFVSENLKKYATQTDRYDVVWVLLDSGILTQSLFQEVWLPVARSSKIPFVTGAEELVMPELDFATFAVTPNFSDLANQAVQQVESILVDHVSPKDLGVEELISVNKILNLNRAHALELPLNESSLKDIKIVP